MDQIIMHSMTGVYSSDKVNVTAMLVENFFIKYKATANIKWNKKMKSKTY